MNETERINDQLHRAFYGGPWHGPSVKEVLAGVSADLAGSRPQSSAHSIWELVNHLRAWTIEVAATVDGKPYESLKGDRDWPPATATGQPQWEQTLAELERAQESLEQSVAALAPEKLGEGERSLYFLLLGVVQHHAYHAGQIALLKKRMS